MSTGIYIHIPFCVSKCSYCCFVSRPWDELLAQRYWRAVVRELEAFGKSCASNCAVDTVYFGGGTPSLLPAGYVAGILGTCRSIFDVSPECEFSLEANPGTLTAEKLGCYRSLGINRISIGAQSFSDQELAAIGRIHKAGQIGKSCALLKACGFHNLNLDLIIGLPGQTEIQWRASLERAVALAPSHLSLYMLELDPKVPLYDSVAAGRTWMPDEDTVADRYLWAIDFLESRGYPQYEISNFALPGCECRHNLKYWRREPVLAFGVAAHSHDGVARYANVADLSDYLSAVEGGQSPVQWREPADPARDLEETIFLGLRLRRGLDWARVRRNFRTEQLAMCEATLRDMAGAGLLEWHDTVVRLTRRGMLLSNEVFQKFVGERSPHEG
ncbi:MAG: radical SAM family heme chaperone HemW [Acidobacteriia bacterium]|nr:radical SAM family heme chaperone HemW [Terriglobia bacterium]